MISWTVVLVMLLLASDSYSTDDWPKREVYFKRKNISGTIEYVIKLCASGMEDNKLIQRCANYKWKSNDNKNVTHECKVLDSSKGNLLLQ